MIKVNNIIPPRIQWCNTYLLESNGEFAIVDPAVDYEVALKQYPQIQGNIKYILITHAHYDHFFKINSWLTVCPTVIIGKLDGASLSDYERNCAIEFGSTCVYLGEYTSVDEGDTIKLGGENITVMHTPGHTKGSVSYLLSDAIITGDVIWADGRHGRTDFYGGDANVLLSTIDRLLSLDGNLICYPGHDDCAKIRDIKTKFY